MNYTITSGNYKPLSDILGQEYSTTDAYIIHINKTADNVLEVLTTTDTPDNTERGKEYPAFQEVEVKADTGDDVYLRADTRQISVDISVKPSA